MYVSTKIMEKEFASDSMKKTYLDACKWVSTTIIAKTNSENITYDFKKLETKNNIYRMKVSVYVSIDEEEVLKRNCDICKEFNNNYFSSQNKYMCEVCRMPPYRNRVAERLKTIKKLTEEKIFS